VDNDRIVKYWTEVSDVVLAARTNLKFADAAEYLRGELQADTDGVVSHALLLWLGDTLAADGDLAEATNVFSELVDRFPDRPFPGAGAVGRPGVGDEGDRSEPRR
jgi:Flp pilus assembly protein TadD